MMLPLHFHYEDVLRQDLLLKQNHANIMQVPGLYEIRLAPKAGSDLRVPIGKLAMEILSGQRFKEVQSDPFSKARKSARTNPFIGAGKDSGNAFARQSVLRGHATYNFLVRMLTVMSMLDSRAEIRENTIKFFMETEFCEFSPELEDHFEIFEHIRGFNVTIVTSADTKDETSLLWSGFMSLTLYLLPSLNWTFSWLFGRGWRWSLLSKWVVVIAQYNAASISFVDWMNEACMIVMCSDVWSSCLIATFNTIWT